MVEAAVDQVGKWLEEYDFALDCHAAATEIVHEWRRVSGVDNGCDEDAARFLANDAECEVILDAVCDVFCSKRTPHRTLQAVEDAIATARRVLVHAYEKTLEVTAADEEDNNENKNKILEDARKSLETASAEARMLLRQAQDAIASKRVVGVATETQTLGVLTPSEHRRRQAARLAAQHSSSDMVAITRFCAEFAARWRNVLRAWLKMPDTAPARDLCTIGCNAALLTARFTVWHRASIEAALSANSSECTIPTTRYSSNGNGKDSTERAHRLCRVYARLREQTKRVPLSHLLRAAHSENPSIDEVSDSDESVSSNEDVSNVPLRAHANDDDNDDALLLSDYGLLVGALEFTNIAHVSSTVSRGAHVQLL
jgi:hypothetical protein